MISAVRLEPTQTPRTSPHRSPLSLRGSAPSTLGTFLRTFAFGHIRQLDGVASAMLAELARRTPLLAGVEKLAYVDVDDTEGDLRIRQARRLLRLQRREGTERADRDREHARVGAGDLRDPAPQGIDRLRPRRGLSRMERVFEVARRSTNWRCEAPQTVPRRG